MITLVIWSFLLSLVPLTAGATFSLTRALMHRSSSPIKVEGNRVALRGPRKPRSAHGRAAQPLRPMS
jgi:hypothetical protein